MAVHAGPCYDDGEVSIGPADVERIRRAPCADDVAASIDHWLAAALVRDDIYYFSIYRHQLLVGQILLHDIDPRTGESLVAYHLFTPNDRGHGIGTRALQLMQAFVRDATPLMQLVIITSCDNVASQRVAQRCGFVYTGPSREDPTGMVFRWKRLDTGMSLL